MDAFALGGLAAGLAMDAFAVSVGLGMCGSERLVPRACRVAACFGLFQTGMTLAGYFAGWAASSAIYEAGRWAAAGILWLVGIHMCLEALLRRKERCECLPSRDPARGWSLLSLGVATSLDAFGAGMGLGFLGAGVWLAAAVIGLVAAALSALGVALACWGVSAAGRAFSRGAEFIGGGVIVLIGVKLAACASG